VPVRLRCTATVAGVATLLACVGPASAVAAPVEDKVTLRFNEAAFEYARSDSDNLFEVGDTYTVTSELLRPGKSRRVGTTRTACASIDVTGPPNAPDNVRWRCGITLRTASGTIRGVGEHDWRAEGTVRYAIVAGTGRYAGAAGRITRQFVNDAQNRLTLRFSTARPT
jgi:hypothetical protein